MPQVQRLARGRALVKVPKKSWNEGVSPPINKASRWVTTNDPYILSIISHGTNFVLLVPGGMRFPQGQDQAQGI